MTEPSQYFKGRTVQEQMNEVIGYVDVRSAEVATDAIAADVAQVHQDMLDADADAAAAAASAAAAAGTLANAVKKTGESSQSIAGDIAVAGTLSGGMVTGTVITAPAPVNNTDAANKKYVDDQDALDAKLAGATFTGQLNASGQRAYSPGNTTDVATIGTLDAYAPMVRTTGNQDIGGVKSFYNSITQVSPTIDITSTPDPDNYFIGANINFVDKNNVNWISLRPIKGSDGKSTLQAIIRRNDGTYDYLNIATSTA